MEVTQELLNMAKEYVEQDNASTAYPLQHVVMVKRAHYCRPGDLACECNDVIDYVILHNSDVFDIDEFIESFDLPYDGEETDLDVEDFAEEVASDVVGAEVLAKYFTDEIYDGCGTFLTRKAAQHFIDTNRHHVGKYAYVYTKHAWRNSEAGAIDKLLRSIYKG